MSNNHHPLSLPNLLNLDALTCGIMGAGLIMASGPINALTGLPTQFLFWAGALLLPVAAFMAVSARLAPVPGWAANTVILGNCGWAITSLALPLTGLISPNPVGWALLVGQAGFVAVMAFAEFSASSRLIAFSKGQAQ